MPTKDTSCNHSFRCKRIGLLRQRIAKAQAELAILTNTEPNDESASLRPAAFPGDSENRHSLNRGL